MHQNEILKEIRRVRDEYAQSFGHDLDAIVADLQKRQAENGKSVVDLSWQHKQVTEAQKKGSTTN